MNLIESITYTPSSPTFPAGTVVDHILCTLTGAATPAVSQSVAPLTATVTFPNVAADTYTVTAQAIDATGAPLGTAVSTTLVVTAPATISLNLPSAVTAAQA
jgi:hypothetical protein